MKTNNTEFDLAVQKANLCAAANALNKVTLNVMEQTENAVSECDEFVVLTPAQVELLFVARRLLLENLEITDEYILVPELVDLAVGMTQ